MARVKRPGVKVLLVGRPDTEAHTDGVGEFLPAGATASEIVETVEKMLAT
jgi:hypothetical protein